VDPDGNPATDDGAHVVNMSLGSLSRTSLFDAVSQLLTCNIPAKARPDVDFTDPGYDGDKQRCSASRGAVMVVASGNNGSDRQREYPAAESAYGKLSIGASTAAHRRATFSNFGSWVDLAAPGEAITSTFAGGTYATWSGTSMAAPLVSGTAALLRTRFPSMATKDLARRIDRTTANLCGTDLREVDAMAALTNKLAKDRSCL
jgi:subtilisin family serine protease